MGGNLLGSEMLMVNVLKFRTMYLYGSNEVVDRIIINSFSKIAGKYTE